MIGLSHVSRLHEKPWDFALRCYLSPVDALIEVMLESASNLMNQNNFH
jgi:hypothetical protein